LRAEVRAFIREVVIPAEAREGEPGLLAELHAIARERGLFARHVARRWGGLGLDTRA
jgi:alkylation response protein AidB-like acyl-CoA dehydrogenase